MQGRLASVLIVIFWLATMGWLITTKFLPPLLVGTPPSYASITAARPTVTHWDIHWNGHSVGHATSRLNELPDELRELASHVVIERLPIEALARQLPGGLLQLGAADRGTISLDAKSAYSIGPLGNLVGLRSEIELQPFFERIHITGRIDGPRLMLEVNTGDFQYTTHTNLPQGGLVSDAFSPQMRLPGLRLGQNWTEPVYSPFGGQDEALDVLRVSVDQRSTLNWHGQVLPVLVVNYRSSNQPADAPPRARLWVTDEGTVLQQEVQFLASRIAFIRQKQAPESEAEHVSPEEAWDQTHSER